MLNDKRIMIIGASSAIAKECARIWVFDNPAEIVLVGRNKLKIEKIASDLRARAPNVKISAAIAEFLTPDSIVSAVDKIFDKGAVDIALIAHGCLPQQNSCQSDISLCNETLQINAISPVLFAEATALNMEKYKTGTIALIGSVAGDRGRKSNYVYGAAKSLLARYAQGMQHRFFGSNIKIVLIKPGPTDTPMTSHLKSSRVKLADPSLVASRIIKGISKGQQVVYAPPKWKLIMMFITHMPQVIFNRLDI